MSAERIAAVLRIRRLQERRERSEVASRRLKHRAAEHAARVTWQSVTSRSLDGAPLSAGRLATHRAVIDGGVAVAKHRDEAAIVAAHAVDVQLGTWSVAARRVEGLERLDERLRSSERAERERRAAVEIDDLVLARRGRTGGGT